MGMQKLKYAEIDLSAIRHNIEVVRARVGAGVKIMPAVKANAYGHGVLQVSKACIAAGADVLCVASIDEGIELREAGFDVPVLILGCSTPAAADDIVEYNIASTVCDIAFAHALSNAATKQNKRIPIHIKIDTGMGRIGVSVDEAIDFIREASTLPGADIGGIFTHFPSSDEADPAFTTSQIQVFKKLVLGLQRQGHHIRLAHASNSGGILAYPDADFDAVRPGIMIYGMYPSEDVAKSIPIKEALTLKTRIVFLKESDTGTTVSYGRTYTLKRRSKVATLPIGYADGYNRLLSSRGEAAVRGCRVPVIGRVCMDQIMIDVTDVPGVELGDEVVLYGGGYDYLSISKIAEKIGTISYEVLCAIGSRVERVYKNS